MLIRDRLSRIFFLNRFFEYPVSLTLNTIAGLGIIRLFKIGISYLKIKIFPISVERSLEDFFINRFGKELYLTFFKEYTEKVWGIDCDKIKPEWGAQRIKGLSITKAIINAVRKLISKQDNFSQKGVETSLIEKFLYPKYGPGQMWETVANRIIEKGGEIHLKHKVTGININKNKVTEVVVKNMVSGELKKVSGDYFISTMPVKDLIAGVNSDVPVPAEVSSAASGLMYRDFVTVGLLLSKFKIRNETKIKTVNNIIPDTWIYIQEPGVKLGRLQIFNNWSPYMAKDENTVWVGLEYFCNAGDEMWAMRDSDFIKFAIDELVLIGVIDKSDALDSTVIRMEKTYPAYFGTYDKFNDIRKFTDKIGNLFLTGRNGMHRYNNMDHSMLTAITAVNNIIQGITSKDNIWSVNTEEEYHEEARK